MFSFQILLIHSWKDTFILLTMWLWFIITTLSSYKPRWYSSTNQYDNQRDPTLSRPRRMCIPLSPMGYTPFTFDLPQSQSLRGGASSGSAHNHKEKYMWEVIIGQTLLSWASRSSESIPLKTCFPFILVRGLRKVIKSMISSQNLWQENHISCESKDLQMYPELLYQRWSLFVYGA